MVSITEVERTVPATVTKPIKPSVTPVKKNFVPVTVAPKKKNYKISPAGQERNMAKVAPPAFVNTGDKSSEPKDANIEVASKTSRNKRRGKGKKSDLEEQDPYQKTPYQGRYRCCGRFHCDYCGKEWFSPHSWANNYQICKGCYGQIYPYAQFPLQRKKTLKEEPLKKKIPEHRQDLCQMCRTLGYKCIWELDDPTRRGEKNNQREKNKSKKR